MCKKNTIRAGFTLVEALVAVSIVLVGVAATFHVAQIGLSSTSSVRNRITAVYLAHEAVEAVINKKDSNLQRKSFESGQGSLYWLNDIVGAQPSLCHESDSSDPCGFNSRAPVEERFFDCTPDNCRVYNNNGFYEQNQGSDGFDTGFVREIEIDEMPSSQSAKVVVRITRPDDPRFNPIEIKTFIYAWF